MTRKEMQKISLKYRTLSSQMLKMNSQEEMYCIQQFFNFITETKFIMDYICECRTKEYDFKQIFSDKLDTKMVIIVDGHIHMCMDWSIIVR